MKHSFQYAILTLKHKWYVFFAGFILSVPLRQLVIHDWSKFTPSELPAYGQRFFGSHVSAIDGGGKAFSYAWLHHQNHNPHHWEYWITRSDHRIGVSGNKEQAVALAMPERYAREMVADWCGASKAYTGQWQIGEWVEKNIHKMNLHPKTKLFVVTLALVWDRGVASWARTK